MEHAANMAYRYIGETKYDDSSVEPPLRRLG
jgi:hypothetical protein